MKFQIRQGRNRFGDFRGLRDLRMGRCRPDAQHVTVANDTLQFRQSGQIGQM